MKPQKSKNGENKSKTNTVQINSNEELYHALQEATAGRIKQVGEKDNPMTLQLKENLCVTIYADNHEILAGIFRGDERFVKHYHSYAQAYRVLLAMESDTAQQKRRKTRPIKDNNQRKNKMNRVNTLIWGIICTLFGGIPFLCCISGAIRHGFQPFHVYLFLLFLFGIILFAGIATIYIGFRKNTKLEAVLGNPYPVELPDEKTVNILLQELKKRTEQFAISIHIDEGSKPTLTGSKLGGIPYWDHQKEYPAASDGQKLVLLAQINLSELPENDLLPSTGLLQFFILDDRGYGLPLQESAYAKNTCQVVYHDEIDESVTEEQVLALGIRTSRDFTEPVREQTDLRNRKFPVVGEYAVCFRTVKAYMNDNDIRCNALLHKIAEEMGIELDSRLEFYQMFNEWDKRYEDIHEATWGHYLFGYPHFRQEDPRSPEGAEYYDTLLFQLDSDSFYERWRVLWGDAGVGAFFINSKMLAAMNFEDVLYTWDCC